VEKKKMILDIVGIDMLGVGSLYARVLVLSRKGGKCEDSQKELLLRWQY